MCGQHLACFCILRTGNNLSVLLYTFALILCILEFCVVCSLFFLLLQLVFAIFKCWRWFSTVHKVISVLHLPKEIRIPLSCNFIIDMSRLYRHAKFEKERIVWFENLPYQDPTSWYNSERKIHLLSIRDTTENNIKFSIQSFKFLCNDSEY